ncbi:MAG TPA: hypothetical protein VE591_12800 [Candidatus Acidoferrum sp.]|nr:hypothetical protein [Candidatus Acidoferrum sp.]
MDSAKRALFERLIDDASLFPPAALPMRRALRAHARHSESAYGWIGGRFVAPASQLDALARDRDPAQRLELSVILDAAASGAKGDAVLADLERIGRAQLDGATVASLELKLPGSGLDEERLRRAIAQISERWPSDPIALWVEPPYHGGWPSPAERSLATIAALRAEAPHLTVGAKLRCGGLQPEAVPALDDLAAFLIAARQLDVPWKATAGLHHPVRGEHDGRMMHGFLNLVVAAIALHAGALEPARLGAVLAEEDPLAFVVDPAHLGWREVRVEAEGVASGRRWCVSYGSCSFDEPVNDLRELGILT